ncbi:transposase [Burkholderia pseudomallei]|uniref:integrase core domain-containing protein n=1 Tax=Burkholderia pseudomallei TaxID=28450 RepID=UPI000ABD3A8D|nr:integrase core domain-containing protein [Burkholderia pseudomallei]MBF3540243.1 transposase [Burkholderia pseudomallei]MBF3602463.1 transposase [Burkholderia pseudomallei]MBF3696279.1 transposase [Burkholderia pseudomallei]MBF4088336.1 transposase [Burkholderia pseudomallei]MBF4128228.1 transposase [Burkholderia pseudomallei]
MDHETTPTRRFDAMVGAITAKEPVDDAETEDVDLTDYLMRAWHDLIHHSSTPVPRCPHCDGLRIRPDRPSGKSKLPIYFCHTCKKSFKPTQNAYIESFNGKFRDECPTQ